MFIPMELPTVAPLQAVWYLLVAVLWIGFFVLEGFDFGAGMLMQVLSNLLSNSNRHTQKGEITIRATVSDKQVKVTVLDTGEGISTALLPNIFGRGAKSANRTGLGLSISKSIIESMGGRIYIESELGKGTAASFILPVYQRQEEEG